MKKIKTSKGKWGLPVSKCLLPFHGYSQRLHGILCLFSSPLAMALHLLCQLVTDGFLVLGCIVMEPWWVLVIEWDLKESRSQEEKKKKIIKTRTWTTSRRTYYKNSKFPDFPFPSQFELIHKNVIKKKN